MTSPFLVLAWLPLLQARPAGPPVQSLSVGGYRIVLAATPLARAARRLGGRVDGPRACFVTREGRVRLTLESSGADGTVTGFAIAAADSAADAPCSRLRVRWRAVATGDGLKLGRLRADVTSLLGGSGRDSAGVAVYDFRGTRGPAAMTGGLRVTFRGDTVSALRGSLRAAP